MTVTNGDVRLAAASALGLTPPRYLHVPLLVGDDGRRLAKRHGDTSLRHLRANGVRSEELCGYLASLCGLRAARAPCSPRELLDGFDLTAVLREPQRADDHGLL